MGNRLTVFVGRGPLSVAIQQALEDLAALKLVVGYLWVDADTFESSTSVTSCVSPVADGSTKVEFLPFNQALTRTRAASINIGVINDLTNPAGAMTSQQLGPLIDAIDAVGIGHGARRTNLLLAAVGTRTAAPLPLLSGYNNVMLAPEDSIGPEVTPVSYVDGNVGGRYVLHCAAGIASLFGLWEGHENAPVLQMEPAHGNTFRLVRTFYRRIDGQEVQQKLRERIFHTETNPLPLLVGRGDKTTAHYATEYRQFNEQCAEQLIQDYLPLLKGERSRSVAEGTRHQSNTGAAGEYLRTFAKNFVTAPVRWFRNSSDELSGLTSQALQSSLYGTDSRVQVGAVPHAGYENPKHIVAERTNREQVAREYAPLWESYENLVLTMVDAQPRPFGSSNVPRFPTAVAAHETAPVYVVPSSRVVIPGPSVRFGNELPPQLKSMLGMDSIASYDLIEAERYERTLSQQAERQHRDVGRIIGEFGRWRDEHSGSFAAIIGRRLNTIARELEQEAAKWQARSMKLRNQKEAAPSTAARLILALRWLGYVTFWSWALFLGLWTVYRTNLNPQGLPVYQWARAFEMSATSTKATFLGVWFVLWLLCFIVQVALETRDEIRVLNRRRTLIDDIEAADRNYIACLEAREKLDIGYQQFVALNHQLGAVLERPFGKVQQYRVDNITPANDMPDSVLLAEAAPDEAVIENLARQFRSRLYHQGWMDNHVVEARAVATAQLEKQAGIPVRTDNMHALTGRGTGTALDRMGQLMASAEYNAEDRSLDEWSDITTALNDAVRRERTTILQPMRITRAGQKMNAPSLQPLQSIQKAGSFNAEFITDAGRVNSVNLVNHAYFHQADSELDAIGVSEVLVQVSYPARAEDIRVSEPETSTQAPPAPPSGEQDWGMPPLGEAPTVWPQGMPGEGEF